MRDVAKWTGGVAVLGLSAALLWASQRKSGALPPAPATPSARGPEAPPSASASEPKVRALVYDCSQFGAAASPAPPCAELPAAEQELLDAARSFVVTASGCHYAFGKDRREHAEHALRALARLPTPAAPSRRALLQNAALRLEACSAPLGEKASAPLAGGKQRGGLPSFRLSGEELDALPSAEAQLSPWLGDTNGWARAEQPPSRFHEASSGSTFSYQALLRGQDVANVARAVLVDTSGNVRVTSLVARLLLRRTTDDAVYVCIAEHDPTSQACGTARALRPIAAAQAELALAGGGGPACRACHAQGARRSGSFGPSLGLALADAQTRAERELSAVLGW